MIKKNIINIIEGFKYLRKKLFKLLKFKSKFSIINNPQNKFGKKTPVTNEGKKVKIKNVL